MEEIITQILQDLGRNLLDADISFIKEAERFDKFEKTVRELCTATAARILSEALTDLDDSIRDNADRKRYSIQRRRDRNLVSTVGTIKYKHTVFWDKKEGGYRSLLHDMIRLPERERFTTEAEALVLQNAAEESYRKTADKLKIGDQEITKTTVMNIVHVIPSVIPEANGTEEKKKLE